MWIKEINTNNRVGITETGDPAFDLDTFDNLCPNANIIITKRLTDALVTKLAEHRGNCILHLTVTGWGSSTIEPLVPTAEHSRKQLEKLLAAGFPVRQVVLRIDPVILSEEGRERLGHVLDLFAGSRITRYRVSFLDMYNHVKERFTQAGIAIPPDHTSFHAPLRIRRQAIRELQARGEKEGFTVEACGEPQIESVPCISQKDIDILGKTDTVHLGGSAGQRRGCSCPANKIQILTRRAGRCRNACLYCYWKGEPAKDQDR